MVVLGFMLSEVYACELDEEALRLIREFASMVKWWAERGRDFEGGPYEEFRKKHYGEWCERWRDWNRQLIHTSVHVAYERLKLSESPENRPKTVNVDVNFAVVHPKMVKVEGGRLRVSTVKEGYAYVKLIPKCLHQKRLLEQVEAGVWRIGQTVLTEKWAVLPFTAERLEGGVMEAISELAGK
ncbi:MAG: hypothetical protein QXH00_06495 [Candidatus Jordarchaeales archaeon]